MILEADPSGTATFTTWSSMPTRGATLPRNRRFPFLPGLGGSVALSMPLGLIVGRSLPDLSVGRSPRVARQRPVPGGRVTTLPDNSTSRASSSARLRSERLMAAHMMQRVCRAESTQGKK